MAHVSKDLTRVTWTKESPKCKSKYFNRCVNLSKLLSTDTYEYTELVCDFVKDGTVGIYLVSIVDFILIERKDKRVHSARKVLSLKDKIKYPSWCVGGVCKERGCSDMQAKFPVVYKTILQYRGTNVTKTYKQQTDKLYETVRVCTTCKDELNVYVVTRAKEEVLSKKREFERKLNDETRRKFEAQQMQQMKIQEEQARLARVKKVEELASNIERHQERFEKRLKAARLTAKKAKLQESTYKAVKVKPPPKRKTKLYEIKGVTSTVYFGNEEEKLLLSTRIMNILSKGDNVRLYASFEENNNSLEECRLVLRSIYLEFRGMCKDKGYFPDVPNNDVEAFMTLECHASQDE